MSVIAFPDRLQRDGGPWRPSELNQVVASLGPGLESGEADGWEVGVTERGDPQLYLLGPAPDRDCILCVSRLGALYVLEDGGGRVLFEHDSLRACADTVKAVLREKKAGLIARVTLIWCAVRQTLEEKMEALLGEGEEMLVHFAPQLAALA
jgi:hypothetical protein